ncbi:TraR/DksA C4-type zinc finger protein [Niveispirillum cyanobacteriorum]|uniref:Molecular chaperone DnaK n=1 Tax=Niveispirillum cyanobacteriorum TaxID=1612173 RepID=A0A2K9NE37_9PROT|nr:TraR/DksA C4-type zinc finger protein [Niveispirillum cyanobacteriorum]AUN31252.1 molecular chaperone DnaK [Niveispirillum cyanobacteriorum]GGE72926.1 hypothetical protein GCM10011317_32690 [Niveispirillum cyanobacteriorum]
MVSDVVDLAQAAQLDEQAAILARGRRGAEPEGRTECGDCGEPIEPARLAVHPHAQRCLFCQDQIEERLRR